jgi:hypothetical protein
MRYFDMDSEYGGEDDVKGARYDRIASCGWNEPSPHLVLPDTTNARIGRPEASGGAGNTRCRNAVAPQRTLCKEETGKHPRCDCLLSGWWVVYDPNLTLSCASARTCHRPARNALLSRAA